MESMKIRVGELTFDATTCGQRGQPLVLFLHGFPQTSYAWRHQLPFLAAQGYCCVAPDQRGYSAGARPAEQDQYAMALLVEDMLGVMDALDYPEAHIVGHDWGGQISWLLGALHPDRVRSLTVLSRPHPAAFGRAMKDDAKQSGRSGHHRAFMNKDSARLLLEEDARRLRRTLSGQGVAEEHIRAYLEVLGDEDALDAAINWYRVRGPNRDLAGANIPVVKVPTLYLWGDADATVGRMAVDRTRDFVSPGQYRLVVVPGAGHFITDQVVDVVNDNLLEHIRQAEIDRN